MSTHISHYILAARLCEHCTIGLLSSWAKNSQFGDPMSDILNFFVMHIEKSSILLKEILFFKTNKFTWIKKRIKLNHLEAVNFSLFVCKCHDWCLLMHGSNDRILHYRHSIHHLSFCTENKWF